MIWAHGIGGRADLPVPIDFFLYGAALVLVLSFAALAALWPEPRLQDGPRQRVLGGLPLRPLWVVLRVVGLAFLMLVVVAGLFGTPAATRNITPVSAWVVFWLAVPFAAAVAGNLWAALNPWRTLADLLGFEEGDGSFLARWGVWPATAAFLAFTWLELIHPAPSDPRVLGTAALVYTVYALALAGALGPGEGLQVGEAFTTYHRLISSIAPFGRDRDGRPVWRGWLRALPVLPRWPGLAAFVVAMIGTVTYDGLSETPFWNDLTFRLLGSAYASPWFGTLALLGTVGVVGGGYLLACRAAARVAGGTTTGEVAQSFAHSLVPIALAYAAAHYVTLVLFEGQLFLIALSDPLGLGWNLLGTAGWRVDYTWFPPLAVWYTQVAVIVGGHVLGVLLAHDRAVAEFTPRVAVRTQYAMLALMVLLTMIGLTILSAG